MRLFAAAIRLLGAAILPGSMTRYDPIMRECRVCAGPMPEIVREDALYCSTRCKLKAQRRRKKERARQALDDSPRAYEPVAPFREAVQLSFFFMEDSTSSAPTQTGDAAKSDASSSPETWTVAIDPAPTVPAPTPSKTESWLKRVGRWLKDGPDDAPPGQRSKWKSRDIV